MATFETTEPIRATLNVAAGDVRVTASERTDTTVDIVPANPSKPRDVRAAENTTVEFLDGQLVIRTPNEWRRLSFRSMGMVRVTLTVPAGSRLQAETGMGAIDAVGRLDIVTAQTGMGPIRLEQTGALRAHTGHGDVSVGHVTGEAGIVTGSGSIRLDRVDGALTARTSNGDIEVGTTGGEARLKSSNGSIRVASALSSVTAKTANGSVHVACVETGTARVETATGNLSVGIKPGTAVWLDLHTSFGAVRNQLQATTGPVPNGQQVSVTAHTSHGDIDIVRAVA